MNRLKSAVLVAALSSSLAAPAFADGARPAALPEFSAANMQQLFEQDAKPMQLAALSQQEMTATEGALGPWGAAIGGFGGGASYALNTGISGSPWSWAAFGGNVAAGALGGAFASPLAAIWGVNSAIGINTFTGVAQRYGW